jgi:hypothetical protein
MVSKLRSASQRHKLDLSGTNFISRVAQRYGIADKVRKGPSTPQQAGQSVPAAAQMDDMPTPEAIQPDTTVAKPARAPAKPKAAMPDVDVI